MRTSPKDTFYSLKKDDTKWMDREGNILEIKDMDIWHIFFTLNMLNERNATLEGKWDLYQIPELLTQRYENEFCVEFPEHCI